MDMRLAMARLLHLALIANSSCLLVKLNVRLWHVYQGCCIVPLW